MRPEFRKVLKIITTHSSRKIVPLDAYANFSHEQVATESGKFATLGSGI